MNTTPLAFSDREPDALGESGAPGAEAPSPVAAPRLKGISARTRAQIDQWMEAASEALQSGRYFECERLAAKALDAACRERDYPLIARLTLPLQEARRQRRLMAAEAGQLFVLHEEPPEEGFDIRPGCYVFMPPCVAAEARRLARAALEREIPVIAFACEPITGAGLLPIVVFGPATIRTRVRPPRQTTTAWCLEAIEALSVEAIASVDTGRMLMRQVEELKDKLDTLPESELLHQRLAEIALQATHAPRLITTPPNASAADEGHGDDAIVGPPPMKPPPRRPARRAGPRRRRRTA